MKRIKYILTVSILFAAQSLFGQAGAINDMIHFVVRGQLRVNNMEWPYEGYGYTTWQYKAMGDNGNWVNIPNYSGVHLNINVENYGITADSFYIRRKTGSYFSNEIPVYRYSDSSGYPNIGPFPVGASGGDIFFPLAGVSDNYGTRSYRVTVDQQRSEYIYQVDASMASDVYGDGTDPEVFAFIISLGSNTKLEQYNLYLNLEVDSVSTNYYPYANNAAYTLCFAQESIYKDYELNKLKGEKIVEETFNGEKFLKRATYYDKFGRPEQAINIESSVEGNDIVSFYKYDCMNRGDSISYLPYAVVNNDGAKRSNPVADQRSFYLQYLDSLEEGNYAFSRTEYDRSPFGIVKKSGGVGKDFSIEVGHPVEYNIRLNNAADSICRYQIKNDSIAWWTDYYQADRLMVKKTSSEISRGVSSETYEYTNTDGLVVASENRIGNDRRITYYVYDEMQRRRYVLPHDVVKQLPKDTDLNPSSSLNRQYAYYSEYDKYGRVVRSYKPAEGWVYVVYDKKHRQVMVQDGIQRSKSPEEWTYYVYDDLNRIVEQSVIVCNITQEQAQGLYDTYPNTYSHIKGLTNILKPFFNYVHSVSAVKHIGSTRYGGYDYRDPRPEYTKTMTLHNELYICVDEQKPLANISDYTGVYFDVNGRVRDRYFICTDNNNPNKKYYYVPDMFWDMVDQVTASSAHPAYTMVYSFPGRSGNVKLDEMDSFTQTTEVLSGHYLKFNKGLWDDDGSCMLGGDPHYDYTYLRREGVINDDYLISKDENNVEYYYIPKSIVNNYQYYLDIINIIQSREWVCDDLYTVVNSIPEISNYATSVTTTIYNSYKEVPPKRSYLAFSPVAGIVENNNLDQRNTGLKIFEKAAILDGDEITDDFVERAFYYDRKGQLVQTVEKNHLGGISRYSAKYDFVGNILESHESHVVPDGDADVKITEFSYDDYGRLLSNKTMLNDGESAIMEYRYDDLGKLASKNFIKQGRGVKAAVVQDWYVVYEQNESIDYELLSEYFSDYLSDEHGIDNWAEYDYFQAGGINPAYHIAPVPPVGFFSVHYCYFPVLSEYFGESDLLHMLADISEQHGITFGIQTVGDGLPAEENSAESMSLFGADVSPIAVEQGWCVIHKRFSPDGYPYLLADYVSTYMSNIYGIDNWADYDYYDQNGRINPIYYIGPVPNSPYEEKCDYYYFPKLGESFGMSDLVSILSDFCESSYGRPSIIDNVYNGMPSGVEPVRFVTLEYNPIPVAQGWCIQSEYSISSTLEYADELNAYISTCLSQIHGIGNWADYEYLKNGRINPAYYIGYAPNPEREDFRYFYYFPMLSTNFGQSDLNEIFTGFGELYGFAYLMGFTYAGMPANKKPSLVITLPENVIPDYKFDPVPVSQDWCVVYDKSRTLNDANLNEYLGEYLTVMWSNYEYFKDGGINPAYYIGPVADSIPGHDYGYYYFPASIELLFALHAFSYGTHIIDGICRDFPLTTKARLVTLQEAATETLFTETYDYNIQGRLTEQDSEVFDLKVRYERPELNGTPDLYTGGITEVEWTNKLLSEDSHAYSFGYNPWGQLADSRHFVDGALENLNRETGMTYDTGGNMLTLKRYGEGTLTHDMDYHYQGTRLDKIGAFGTPFEYDHNGNMTKDGRTSLNYHWNYLDLLSKVTDADSVELAGYTWAADGSKCAVRDANGNGFAYLGSLVYVLEEGVPRLESTGFAGGRLVASETQDGTTVSPVWMMTDYLGSVRAVVSGDQIAYNNYYPYGGRWNDGAAEPSRWLYNGKEWQVTGDLSFLDFGSRMYDPDLGRWVNTDPASQTLNPYLFCANSPMMYVDSNGEFWHLIIGAIVGGITNLISNWDNIDGFWDGITSFFVGAGSGFAIAATGGASTGAMLAVSAGTGIITASTNDVIAQTGRNFEGFNEVNWGQVGKSGLIGGVSGAAAGGAGVWASNSSLLANNVNSPLLRSAIVSPLASGVGHVTAGTTWNLFEGQSIGEAFSNSFQGIGRSMAWGTATGLISTTATSMTGGVNPITGRPLRATEITTVLGSQGKYEQLAAKMGANSFELPDDLWNALTPEQRWALNKAFLDDVIYRGDNIRLSNNPNNVPKGSYYYQELNYLNSNGYFYSPNNTWMMKKY